MTTAYKKQFDLNSLVVQYLPLIHRIVSQINLKHTHYDREDLIQIGVMGLIEAYKRYDSEKGVPFQHYAKWRIRGAILDELRKSGKVSRGKMDRINAYYKARSRLQQKLQREPEPEEICSYMSISLKELYEIEDNIHYLSQYSLEEVLFSGQDGEFTLLDVMEDKETRAPEEIVLDEERKKILADAIKKLSSREQLILNLYYYEELTLKEIAEILGVSLPRVSQIHGKILVKLREFMQNA